MSTRKRRKLLHVPSRRSRPSEVRRPLYGWSPTRVERFGRDVTWGAQVRRICLASLLVFGVLVTGVSVRDLRVQSTDRGIAPMKAGLLSANRIGGLSGDLQQDAFVAERLQKEAALPTLLSNPQSCTLVAKNGRTVYSTGTKEGLIPASTQKLATGFAALNILGAETRFVTEVRGVRVGDEIRGPITLVGGGDPTLAVDGYQETRELPSPVYSRVEDLVRQITDLGIRAIPEGIQVDGSIFDDERRPASWQNMPWIDVEIGSLGGAIVNGGYDDPRTRLAAAEPGVAAAKVLAEALRREGVSVGETLAEGVALEEAKVLARVESPRVDEMVSELLSHSDNLTAEMLTKQMGKRVFDQGTTAAGLQAIRQSLKDHAIPLENVHLVDGSGLSRENRSTCQTLLEILLATGSQSSLARGLSVGGESGTLRQRFGDESLRGKVSAKTGTLFNVSGLAGWSQNPDGAFAFVTLQNGVGLHAGRAQEDRLASLLTQSMSPRDETTP